jgi:hypothetical protein
MTFLTFFIRRMRVMDGGFITGAPLHSVTGVDPKAATMSAPTGSAKVSFAGQDMHTRTYNQRMNR